VRPTHAGENDAFIVKISDADGIDITGHIADAGGNPIGSVTVKLSGSTKWATLTNSNGDYILPNLAPGGNYTVTPIKANVTFSPTSQTFNNLTVDQTADFTGTVAQVVIDGRVKDGNGTGVSGVTVTLSGSQSGSVVTSTGGDYSFSNKQFWRRR
jgi:carboxypeptidase family protein